MTQQFHGPDTAGQPDLRPAALGVAAVLERIGDDRLGAPTPCPDWTVGRLIGHVAGLCAAFRDAARKDLGPTTDSDPAGALPPDPPARWRSGLPDLLAGMADAWRSPLAWEGRTRAGGVDLPAGAAGCFALNELLVHGWDLARATGQDYRPDPAGLEAALALLTPFTAGSDGSGPFGRPVPVPPSAPPLDRLVALTGRDPGWRPPR
ncbi:TIGR03086 family metal-binding protein [Streptomyces sp. NPDC088733]|uniref:TIGR03086 family metal-binding protein n=1 Tax=Streptomyces sp. NPDC088733 TaxID=3365880 RepID=UPI003825AA79